MATFRRSIDPDHPQRSHHRARDLRDHVPKKYRRSPAPERSRRHADVWMLKASDSVVARFRRVAAGRGGVQRVAPSLKHLRPGTYDIDARIGDMNANGVLGSMCFPSFPGSAARCSPHEGQGPRRRSCRPTTTGTSTSGAGSTRAASSRSALLAVVGHRAHGGGGATARGKGCHAVSFSENPAKLGLPSLPLGPLGSVLDRLRGSRHRRRACTSGRRRRSPSRRRTRRST